MKLNDLLETQDMMSILTKEYKHGSFYCANKKIDSLEGAPSEIKGDLYASFNNITSLKGIHKIIKKINGGFYVSKNPIKSHILGILLIEGCARIEIDNIKVQKILNKYLPNMEGMAGVLKCQEELFANDLDDFAQL